MNFLNNRFKADNSFSSFPKDFTFSFSKLQDLRYGENPHQAAAFYKDSAQHEGLGQACNNCKARNCLLIISLI